MHTEHFKKLNGMKHLLICKLHEYVCGDFNNANAQLAGEVADIIKDIEQTEKLCWEKKYYESIVTAMEENSEWTHPEMRGYDNWRYSSGRYAPKGHGHRSGYEPWGDMAFPLPEDMGMMGYDTTRTYPPHMHYEDPYGRAMGDYHRAKHGYTETHSKEHKDMMRTSAEQHVKDTVTTMKEIWADADPELKIKMKADIEKLLNTDMK